VDVDVNFTCFVQNTVAHWSETSGSLAQNWEQLENSIQTAQSKLNTVEGKIMPGVKYGLASIPELESELAKLKVKSRCKQTMLSWRDSKYSYQPDKVKITWALLDSHC